MRKNGKTKAAEVKDADSILADMDTLQPSTARAVAILKAVSIIAERFETLCQEVGGGNEDGVLENKIGMHIDALRVELSELIRYYLNLEAQGVDLAQDERTATPTSIAA